MSSNFSIDRRKLDKALRRSPEAANKGAKVALGDIKRDWVREARDIAPIAPELGGNLRSQIQSEVFEPGANGYVEITANATQGDSRFNYGYYIHEKDAGGGNLLTPGTEKKFLDVSAESRVDDWSKWLEEEVEKALRSEGW